MGKEGQLLMPQKSGQSAPKNQGEVHLKQAKTGFGYDLIQQ